MNAPIISNNSAAEVLEKVIIGGDLKSLSSEERIFFYNKTCESLGLNPITRPFEYITLNGKLTLYARKDATEQLRMIHNISIVKLEAITQSDVYIVTAYARNGVGKEDVSTGVVSIGGLKGDTLANAYMKAETKAKRRVTLSIAGLGMLDETEVETIPNPIVVESELETVLRGAIKVINGCENMDILQTLYKQTYRLIECKPDLLKILTTAKDERKNFLENTEFLAEYQEKDGA